jgi:hypothetical protein
MRCRTDRGTIVAMAKKRQPLKQDVVRAIHHEAGYRCANPACRYILVIDVHHIVHVSDGGGNEPSNLLALCPNCHRLHHQGVIPAESVRAWKMILLSLNQAFDQHCVDVLLLDKMKELRVPPDALLAIASLISSNLVDAVFDPPVNPRYAGQSFRLKLSQRGNAFVEGWRNGDQGAAGLAAITSAQRRLRSP